MDSVHHYYYFQMKAAHAEVDEDCSNQDTVSENSYMHIQDYMHGSTVRKTGFTLMNYHLEFAWLKRKKYTYSFSSL